MKLKLQTPNLQLIMFVINKVDKIFLYIMMMYNLYIYRNSCHVSGIFVFVKFLLGVFVLWVGPHFLSISVNCWTMLLLESGTWTTFFATDKPICVSSPWMPSFTNVSAMFKYFLVLATPSAFLKSLQSTNV